MVTRRGADAYSVWSGDSMGITSGPWYIYRAGDGQKFSVPGTETDATFLARIARSKKAGRNLFYEELEEFNPEPYELW